jgi:hypothetical protein
MNRYKTDVSVDSNRVEVVWNEHLWEVMIGRLKAEVLWASRFQRTISNNSPEQARVPAAAATKQAPL